MPSTLAWLDHDAEQRDRVQRVLLLFQEKGTVDELGLGGVRDAFSDRLFPGTSTIHTRLRYFLFIPWIYRELERRKVPASKIGARARETELQLIEPLLASGEQGVIGAVAGESVKILPSAIYWGGLWSWGIRRFSASADVYHRTIDDIQALRNARSDSGADQLETWHPGLPEPPDEFPEAADMRLRRGEAEFIQSRIIRSHPRSLLALLARGGERTDIEYPWQHPRYESFKPLHKLVLHHARLFSEMKHGAAILYNLALARKAGREDLVREHAVALRDWAASLEMAEVHDWNLNELWELTLNRGHTITLGARRFVTRWVELVRSGADLVDHAEAHEMVRLREMALKGARSNFRNERALEEKWRGHSGIGRLQYRWPNVEVILNDLYTGLEAV